VEKSQLYRSLVTGTLLAVSTSTAIGWIVRDTLAYHRWA
jgi:hypothetical protein